MKKWTLGELINIAGGLSTNSKYASSHPVGLPLASSIKPNGGFSMDNLKYYNGPYSKKHLLKPGDLIVSMTCQNVGSSTLGLPAIIPDLKGTRFLLKVRMGRFTIIDPRNLDRKFLFWRLCCPDYRTYMESTASGKTVKHTTKRKIYAFTLHLPSLKRQKEIAATMDAFQDSVDLLNEKNRILEQICFGIFNEWFKPGHSTQKWEMIPLMNLGKIVCGQTPKKKARYYGGDIPFLRCGDLQQGPFVTACNTAITKLGGKSQPNKLIPPNSVSVSCIGTIGLVGITTERLHTNQQINSIIPNNYWLRYYLYYCIKLMVPHLKTLSNKSSKVRIVNTGDFKKLTVPLPPEGLLRQFHQSVAPLFHQILFNIRKIETLESVINTLLYKLPSGFNNFCMDYPCDLLKREMYPVGSPDNDVIYNIQDEVKESILNDPQWFERSRVLTRDEYEEHPYIKLLMELKTSFNDGSPIFDRIIQSSSTHVACHIVLTKEFWKSLSDSKLWKSASNSRKAPPGN